MDFGENLFTTNAPPADSGSPTLALPANPVNYQTIPDVASTRYVIPTGSLPRSDDYPTIAKTPELYPFPIAPAAAPAKSSKVPLILLGVLCLALVGVVAYLVVPSLLKKETEAPDHFGLFGKKDDQFSELRMREFAAIPKASDDVRNDTSLITTESNPNLVLYSDGQMIPISELKLVGLDTVKEDGKIESWEYQVTPYGENSQLKQIRVVAGLPKGHYAFAILKGNFDEGTHRLWAFQVENGAAAPAASQLVSMTMKPTPTPTPVALTKTATPPPDAPLSDNPAGDYQIGVCNESNVVVRSSPMISNSNKVGRLDRGQKVVILKYSANEETWNGVTAPWILVRTPKGKTGWVFGAFID